MHCPRCDDEFEDGIAFCPDCRVTLIDEGAEPVAPAEVHLGTFDPRVADRVTALLTNRAIVHAAQLHDDGVAIVVDETFRDDIRSELVARWSDVLATFDGEQRLEVLALGGTTPGWLDPPTGAWIDRDGRLQVERGLVEESLEDASRQVGPAMAAFGVVLVAFGWYADAGGGLLLLGAVLAVLGVLLPI